MVLASAWLALGGTASAASLDLLEVGGAFGTPAATNPTALWWNPAGLAVGGGTRFLVEGAPTFAKVDAARANPDYGDLNPPSPSFPSEYDYSGTDHLSFNGVVPFLGVSSDFGVDGLGVGVGLFVPTARGGTSDQENGANRYALRAGSIQAIHASLGVAYQLEDKVALGFAGTLVEGSYYANTDTTLYPDSAWQASAQFNGVMPPSFQDGYMEADGYSTTLVFGGQDGDKHGALRSRAFTFAVGAHVTPLADERKLDVALSYNHGMRLENRGDLTMQFQCPPDYDFLVQFGTQQQGLCNSETLQGARMQGKGAIGFDLPSRLQLGISTRPVDNVRLELMGAYVFWSAFTDFRIETDIAADQVQVEDPAVAEETADLVSQTRDWARDNRNTFWVGVDGKAQLNKYVGGGLRVTYDRAAVPDPQVSANNHDTNSLILGTLLMLNPVEKVGLGLSWSHHFLQTRTITNSAYAVSIAGADPNASNPIQASPEASRYFYPSANGTYSGHINRIGVSVRGVFGGPQGVADL